MKRQETGFFEITSIGDEQVGAFIPNPLPLDDVLDMKYLQHLFDNAMFALEQLDSITTILPEDMVVFLCLYPKRSGALIADRRNTVHFVGSCAIRVDPSSRSSGRRCS